MKASESRHLSVRGLRYHVRSWGDPGAPKLLMLHGWMDVSASFQFVVDEFKSDWHVLAPDWRGFGLTEVPQTDSYFFADYLGDLDLLLDALVRDGKERDKLKKFLADTIHERFDQTADPGLVKWFIEQAGSNDPEFIARFVLHMTTHEFMDDLVKVKCPTMIVAAGKEQIGHASAYAEMQKRIAGSELKLYDTAGHNICDGYAAKAVGDLMDFLARRGNG